MTSHPPDVLILGGGPAGCAAARLLAHWGHRVKMIARPAGDERTLAESIPPSCGKLFDVVGVRSVIDAAGFVRTTGNTVTWRGDGVRVETFPEGERGWQVTSGELERLLIQAVRETGVEIVERRAIVDDAAPEAASFVLDCTGRSGLVARARGLRLHETALRTIALVGLWDKPAWEVPDPTHTLIEAYADGWAWSVPVSLDRRAIAVMVDPRTTDLAKSDSARDRYLAEVRKTDTIASLIADATHVEGPWGWDASMYSAARYVDGNVLLVGDAGSFIDPMSSAGIKKALASGWLAAVAVHTALVRPAMRETALEFYAAREAEIYAAFRELTERYLADAAAAQHHPFWSDRQTVTGDDSAQEQTAVAAAFARIRACDTLVLEAGSEVTVEERPAVSGSEIVLESRLVAASVPQGVRYVRDVDVVCLLALAPAHREVPDLFASYCRTRGPVALPDFLVALSTLVARGWLRWA